METAFDPEKTALLIIDMQNDLVKNNSGYFAPMYSMVQRNNVVKNLIRLTDRARQKGADFIDELRPAADDYVVAKRRSGAFHKTDRDLMLRARGLDTLIIGGVVTNGCVENTIRGARELDYHVIVLSDCRAAVMAEAHDHAMRKVFPALGRVRSTEDVLKAM